MDDNGAAGVLALSMEVGLSIGFLDSALCWLPGYGRVIFLYICPYCTGTAMPWRYEPDYRFRIWVVQFHQQVFMVRVLITEGRVVKVAI